MNKNFKAQYTEALTEKQAATLRTWAAWGEKMKMLRDIRKELGLGKVEVEEVAVEQN